MPGMLPNGKTNWSDEEARSRHRWIKPEVPKSPIINIKPVDLSQLSKLLNRKKEY